jgi:hypothetical protein
MGSTITKMLRWTGSGFNESKALAPWMLSWVPVRCNFLSGCFNEAEALCASDAMSEEEILKALEELQ